jgi:pimeloyl-ACP methyl ester carboxylesterase
LPELLIQLNDFQALEAAFKGMAVDKTTFSDDDLEAYKNAFAKRDVLTATLNYYRNVFAQGLTTTDWGILTVPTLLIWGEADAALGKNSPTAPKNTCRISASATSPIAVTGYSKNNRS